MANQSYLNYFIINHFGRDQCINRDLKQSGRQRQGRHRLKSEFLPLIRISKMAA